MYLYLILPSDIKLFPLGDFANRFVNKKRWDANVQQVSNLRPYRVFMVISTWKIWYCVTKLLRFCEAFLYRQRLLIDITNGRVYHITLWRKWMAFESNMTCKLFPNKKFKRRGRIIKKLRSIVHKYIIICIYHFHWLHCFYNKNSLMASSAEVKELCDEEFGFLHRFMCQTRPHVSSRSWVTSDGAKEASRRSVITQYCALLKLFMS